MPTHERKRRDQNVFASLKATQIVDAKPALPAELIAAVLDHLRLPDLLRVARASKRLREMVYDDTRWVQKLKAMGAWNEAEARQEALHGHTKVDEGPDIDALNVLSRIPSIRGHARLEFATVYRLLAPLYFNLDSLFSLYENPEQQAQLLSNLVRFARCDNQDNDFLLETISSFEQRALDEFNSAYEAQDITKLSQYAHVLVTLNGGSSAIKCLVSCNPSLKASYDPLDCLDSVATGHVDLNPSQAFFDRLATAMVEQAELIDQVFPPTVDILSPFSQRLCEDVIQVYITNFLKSARERDAETFVKAYSGTFAQALRFVASLKPTKASPPDFGERAKELIVRCYKAHLDYYLSQEVALFKNKSESQVSHWEKELSDQEASTESFFMSSINRQAAKRDFLSSFKKVVMMPVTVLPFAAAAAAKPTDTTTKKPPSRNGEAPTTELAAKAAIMNSKLEGIKSLFSLELALNLTHYAKASLERTAVMVGMGGLYGEQAKRTCGDIFVALISILGGRHIKSGFDKAVGRLTNYRPRQHGESGQGVEPLVTFLELVNVGDLIQQMIQVFYTQELVSTNIVDPDDFLDPSVKEKKRFEQMLDERVAAGLNKGIDVLMDQIEHIFATTQLASDYNPEATNATVVDIGPSPTAQKVVDLVQSHTQMLVGSTDKNMLDVFTQEVGLRLFTVICKHIKRQRVSVLGGIALVSDINHYTAFVSTLRQKPLLPYFQALRELGQIYLVPIDVSPPSSAGGKKSSGSSIASSQAKDLAAIIADGQRYLGIFTADEVLEFAHRRADWYWVKGDVEKAMYGVGCCVS
ncbi:hypothetical protein K470DRAFT_261920 [Piedraia hortae CBS 480.64]|uniref:F-box domain-containing protein n=1 Tax=Piedraia hortae CBS 480.64 TaxID=1314780 RepID=A0A6A7C7P6_9PEZI|nr:hypothetical protein K470DRAFT_261920 [Piedraia hortae CBS 480.64]